MARNQYETPRRIKAGLPGGIDALHCGETSEM
jgi:hypothetical protein